MRQGLMISGGTRLNDDYLFSSAHIKLAWCYTSSSYIIKRIMTMMRMSRDVLVDVF